MTKRWKLKTNSSNILLVLITLILITAEWTNGQSEELDNTIEDKEDSSPRVQTYVGNDEISRYFFGSSASDNSRVLEDVNRCLDNFQLVTCLKMLLLDRINGLVSLLEDPGVVGKDFHLVRGVLVFGRKNGSETPADVDESESLSLDEEISVKVLRMFRNRCLRLNLFPNVKIEIEPTADKTKDGIVCFSYKIRKEVKSSNDDDDKMEQGRKKSKKGKGGMSMMMMLPQLLMLGFMPFTLASLKAMVMNAVMINMMALNGAIFMTIRNLVFGPRSGDNVKYVNYGYSKDRQTQSRRPVLIIHSPAAFVKQPQLHRKRQSAVKRYPGFFPPADSGPVHLAHGNRHFDEEFLVQGNELDFNGYGHANRKSQPQLGFEIPDTTQPQYQRHHQHPYHHPHNHYPRRHRPSDTDIEHKPTETKQQHQHRHRQYHQQQQQQRQQQMTQSGYNAKTAKNSTYANNQTIRYNVPVFQYSRNPKTYWSLTTTSPPFPRGRIPQMIFNDKSEGWRFPCEKNKPDAKPSSRGEPNDRNSYPVETEDKNSKYPP